MSTWYRRGISTGAMLDRLLPTLSWVNKWAPKPGDISFLSPSLARLRLFILQKLGAPPRQQFHESLCPKFPRNVLSRWRCKLTSQLEQGNNKSFMSRRSHLPHWLYQTPIRFLFICLFLGMWMLRRGHDLPRPTSAFSQLVVLPTNERHDFRIGSLKWRLSRTIFTSIYHAYVATAVIVQFAQLINSINRSSSQLACLQLFHTTDRSHRSHRSRPRSCRS